MEFYKWEGDEEKLLQSVRESFNMLAKVNASDFCIIDLFNASKAPLTASPALLIASLLQHWSRNDKTKCLREVTKAFRFMGQIIRLIIL